MALIIVNPNPVFDRTITVNELIPGAVMRTLNVELTAMDVDQMTVIKLREALEERSLDTSGLKPLLVARMTANRQLINS